MRYAGSASGSRRRTREAATSRASPRSPTTRTPTSSESRTGMSELRDRDPLIFDAIASERRRQLATLELIASENFASDAVLEALGSVMNNKYAEGLPRKRYYGGCEFVDQAEELALERVGRLFGAEHANVQAHSGASANLAAYLAVAEPGSTLLGMSLAHGGHLTHGHPVSFSGKLFRAFQYGVRPEDGRLDYDQIEA